MTDTLRLGALAQISRSVRDIKEAVAWYGETLGLPHLYTFGSLAFFDCGGTRLYLTAEKAPGPESILYLRVQDIRTACEQLRLRGVEFSEAPHMIHRHADGTERVAGVLSRPGRAAPRAHVAGEALSPDEGHAPGAPIRTRSRSGR
jgi:catechol 2,3-dioxygenase-like lactoylglutathione lyase family enzyme